MFRVIDMTDWSVNMVFTSVKEVETYLAEMTYLNFQKGFGSFLRVMEGEYEYVNPSAWLQVGEEVEITKYRNWTFVDKGTDDE